MPESRDDPKAVWNVNDEGFMISDWAKREESPSVVPELNNDPGLVCEVNAAAFDKVHDIEDPKTEEETEDCVAETKAAIGGLFAELLAELLEVNT